MQGLQRSMARFNNGCTHRLLRAALVRRIAALDPAELRGAAQTQASARLPAAPATIDVMELLAFCVPVAVLADALGVDAARTLPLVAAFSEGLAEGTDVGDWAAAELTKLDLEVVSALFQAHDATAAYIAGALQHGSTKATLQAHPPVLSTSRADAAGAQTVVSLRGIPFGSGPHACPGRDIALALGAGVLRALQQRSFALTPVKVELMPRSNLELPVRLEGTVS